MDEGATWHWHHFEEGRGGEVQYNFWQHVIQKGKCATFVKSRCCQRFLHVQLPTLPRSISETPFAFVDVEGDQKENDASTKKKPCKLDDITSLLRGSALFLTFRKQIVAKCQQRKMVFCKWWRADAIVSSSTASQCHFIAMHFCFISFKAASLPTTEEQVRMREAILHYQAIFRLGVLPW